MSRPRVRWDEARGVWCARPYLGLSPSTGRPVRPQRDFPGLGPDEEEAAQAAAEEWYDTLAAASGISVSLRLGDVLRSYVDAMEAGGEIAPSSASTYRSVIRAQVDPTAGDADASELTPWAVSGLYSSLMSGKGREAPLSPNTVIKLHWLLCGAYRWMGKVGVTTNNPMPSVGRPRRVSTEAAMCTMAEFRVLHGALLSVLSAEASSREAIRRRNAAMAAYMALTAAFRCGEAVGISREQSRVRRPMPYWRIHDQLSEKPRLHRRECKDSSVGNVSMLPEDAQVAIAHMGWQASYLGERSEEDRRLMLVTDHDGGWLRPGDCSREFRALCDRLGLDGDITFHSLRHTHASYLIAEGMDILEVQRRMRHSRITTTLEVYGHLMPGSDMRQSEAWGSVMARVRGGRSG